MLKDVVQVCTDGSDLSHKGIESAVEIAKALGLPVLGMTAVVGKPQTGVSKPKTRMFRNGSLP